MFGGARQARLRNGSGEARRTAWGLLACRTKAGVSLRSLGRRWAQSCNLDCRERGQHGQWSRSRALRVRTGRIRLGVMVPRGTGITLGMYVMAWRVIAQRIKTRRSIMMLARRPTRPGVIPGHCGGVGVT